MPYNDSHQHVVKTTSQWNERAVENWVVPRGCLCVELTPDHKTKIKIGEGNKFYHQLPYISESDLSNYYTKSEVDNIINNLNAMSIKSTDEYDSVDDLPTTGNKLGDVRFVKSTNPSIKSDPDTYVWNGEKWLMVSTPIQDIDLSDYVTKEEFNPIKNKLEEIYPKAHTHANKDILDGITQADRDKFDDLHNYDDTELRELIAETGHTHPNKSILDSITYQSILSTADREKFNSLHNYDDSNIQTRVTFLESQSHTHSNKSVLDGITQETLDNMEALAASYVIIKNDITDLKSKSHSHENKDILDYTTAAYTIDQKNELERLANIGPFIGCGPTWNGIMGYVPAPEAGVQAYFLRADGTWAKTKSGDKYKAGEGITILSGEVISDTFPFEIFPKASTVTQYIIYGNASGVGNLVSGRYEIPIKVSAPGYSDRVQTITVNDPLYDGDYIDYQKQVFAHYRTKISDRVEKDPDYGFECAVYSDGHIGYFSPGSYGGSPVVSKPFELTPGASYELHPWDSSGQRYSRFHDGMYINIYDANMNRTRTLYQEHLGNTIIVVGDGEKYMRMTMQERYHPIGYNGYQELYMLYPVESPCQLQQLTLYPGVINTIDVLTTNKPNEIYIEVVQPEEPDPSDPSSDYTGIIYNDGVLDVTQEDPTALNELTIHFRDDVEKTITIPGAEVMTGATASTDGEEGLVPAPLAGDENKFLRGDGTWQDVEESTTYYPGKGIEFGGETLLPTAFNARDFITSLGPIYHGTITKADTMDAFTLTATGPDCYTESHYGSQFYSFTAEPNTKYRVSWTADSDLPGITYAFESRQSTIMYSVSNSVAKELVFTTTSTCNAISLRFGVINTGDSIRYSNINVEKVVDRNDTINAKLGNGLRFDANSAIEAIPYVAGTGIDIESYAPARLPVEYQEVEYIASDGVTQNYINTGIHQPMTIVLDMKYNTNATQQYMGWGVTGKNRYFGVDTYSKYNVEDTPGSVTGIDLDVTERRTITVSFRTDQASTMTIEGQTITNFTTQGSDVYTTNDFLLFTLDTTSYFSNATIYEVTIYDTNFQPIFHGIPCYRVSDDVSGLYDLVSETFKPSIGGNLTVGPDVVPNNSYKINNTGLLSVEQDQQNPNHLTFETVDGDIDVTISGGGNYIAGDGIEITADPTHIIFDREHVIDLRYYFDSQVDCKLPGFSTTPARTYTKTTNEKTLGALVSRYCTGFATPLTGPFFVSTVQSAVEFGQDYDATTFSAAANTFTYLGLTWYYTDIGSPNFGYGMSYVGGDTPSDMLDHMLRLNTVYPENTSLVDIAKDIIDAANLVSTINTVSAKLGNGLQFDANGAIEVDTQYVRVNTTDSFVLLHAKPADWDDNWSKYFELRYDEITTAPPDWDPTKHYKYENDNYVLGTAGDAFASTTWYNKHYVGLDPTTSITFDSDVYYTGELQLIEDGETFDTAFEKINEAIEHIEHLEGEVEFLKDDKIGVRVSSSPERIEFYNT